MMRASLPAARVRDVPVYSQAMQHRLRVRKGKAALLATALLLAGCRSRVVPPEQTMPPNTVLLSQMMRELSAQPRFTETLIQQLEGAAHGGKGGPALLTPRLVDELRKRILGKDWQGLDRFPGLTMREINPAVRVVGDAVSADKPPSDSSSHLDASTSAINLQQFLDLSPYALDQTQTLSLDKPSTLQAFSGQGIVTSLGNGIVRGDGPNQLAPEHAESQRLADTLNRLAANALDGAKPFTAKIDGQAATTPQALIEALAATGHQVTVIDARYFANFGHLHYRGQDVMMPFWIDTRLAVPGTGGPFGIGARSLLVPVAHAEYEWQVRGPQINADISYYFGIDGKSEWRTMDTLDQAWVLKRAAHTYTGPQAVEVTRLAGLLTVAYMHQHEKRSELPFGGYYSLGVCQDGISAIEQHMTGKVTLFPNTADTSLFDDPRDTEVNLMMGAIPKDRGGSLPEPGRIFGSLPTEPGSDGSFDAIAIPGLGADLKVSYAAWQRGRLHHLRGRKFYLGLAAIAFAGALATIALSKGRRAQ
jgi:hypothetical protein